MVSFSSHTKGIIAKRVTTSSLPYLQAIEHTYAQIYEQPFTSLPSLLFQTSDVRVLVFLDGLGIFPNSPAEILL